MRIEMGVRIDHIASVLLECCFLVVRSEPQVGFNVVYAVADEFIAIRTDEPPDAVDLFNVDEAGGGV